MKRVAAGAHLPTPWLFEPGKRPDDTADYCLDCSFLPQCKHRVLVFTLEWRRQIRQAPKMMFEMVSSSETCQMTFECLRIENPVEYCFIWFVFVNMPSEGIIFRLML